MLQTENIALREERRHLMNQLEIARETLRHLQAFKRSPSARSSGS